MLALLLAASLATNCVAKTISCNSVVRATLGAESCTSPVDGTRYDLYAFDAAEGTFALVDVRPLGSSYTNPSVLLVAPDGAAAQTPLVFGPLGVTARYIVQSGGRWLIAVGTRDRFASGNYLVRLTCRAHPTTGTPDDCVSQELSCGQTMAWAITPKSCLFNGYAPQRRWASARVYAVAGDVLRLEATSDDFVPAIGIYENESLLTLVEPERSSVTYAVAKSGRYLVTVSSASARETGAFTLTMSCARSGCLPPIIVAPPSPATVKLGGRATLTVGVNGSEPLETEFFQTWPDLTTFPANDGTFTTPPLFMPAWFIARTRNPCGSDAAPQVIVGIEPPRPRPARH